MREKIRIGFAGTGGMGQMAHLKNYVVLDECEVVAVAELREQTGRAVAARYGISRYYWSAKEMLDAGGLDAVVASRPFTRHGVVLEELLGYGIPVFIEKPLASSVETGERIVDMVEKSGTFLMVGYHKRSDPAVMYAKRMIDDLIASGELGALTYVRITMPAGDWQASGFDHLIKMQDEPVELEPDPPPSDLDKEGREAYIRFVNFFIHQVNLLRHLLCESYRPVFADDAGMLLVGATESGKSCTLEMSPYTTSIDWQESALVCFEHGWIRITIPAPLASNRPGAVEIYRDPGDGTTPMLASPTLPWVHAMKQQAANFIAAVKGDGAPTTDAAEALEDLRVAREYLRLATGK